MSALYDAPWRDGDPARDAIDRLTAELAGFEGRITALVSHLAEHVTPSQATELLRRGDAAIERCADILTEFRRDLTLLLEIED
jgi:hypothetical protein